MREPTLILGPDLIKLIAEIDEFKGRWEALKIGSPDRLSVLRKVAMVESVGSSTRIEGATLSDAQVETLLSILQIGAFRTREEQMVTGYARALDRVFEAHDDFCITESHIRRIHQTLLSHSENEDRHRGSYKSLPNPEAAFDADGREMGGAFETTAFFETPREMGALITWTRHAFDEASHHPLLIIAVFIVTFLAIHPFEEGNGRLSRLLITLLLLRSGYAYVPYASLERVIEENRELYHESLRRTQATLKLDAPDWTPWFGFFLRSLQKQKNGLALRFARERTDVNESDAGLPELSVLILARLREHGRQTISQLEAGTQANRNTLKVRLRELVALGRLRRFGKARATWYSL